MVEVGTQGKVLGTQCIFEWSLEMALNYLGETNAIKKVSIRGA